MNKFFLGLLVLSFITLSSCKDEEKYLPSLTINPTDYIQYVDSNEVVTFTITGNSTSDNTLTKFKISKKLKSETTTIILDSTLFNTSYFSYTYEYKIPMYIDTTYIYFNFELFDNTGKSFKISKLLITKTVNDEKLLTEYSGNIIYTDPFYHATAFNLLTGFPLNASTADSANMHIETYLDSINPSIISYKWTSPANLKFVKYNNFDYANASNKTTEAAYNSGIKNDFIAGILNNDIYITKVIQSNDTSFLVIKVIDISDNTDTENDKYTFNVKK